MAVNYTRPSNTEEKKYHNNIAIAAVFDSVYGHLYFNAMTRLSKRRSVLTYAI